MSWEREKNTFDWPWATIKMPPIHSKLLHKIHHIRQREIFHRLYHDRRMTSQVVKSTLSEYKRDRCEEGKIWYFLKNDKTICTSNLLYLLPDALFSPPADINPHVVTAIDRYRTALIDTQLPIKWIDNLLDRQLEFNAIRTTQRSEKQQKYKTKQVSKTQQNTLHETKQVPQAIETQQNSSLLEKKQNPHHLTVNADVKRKSNVDAFLPSHWVYRCDRVPRVPNDSGKNEVRKNKLRPPLLLPLR